MSTPPLPAGYALDQPPPQPSAFKTGTPLTSSSTPAPQAPPLPSGYQLDAPEAAPAPVKPALIDRIQSGYKQLTSYDPYSPENAGQSVPMRFLQSAGAAALSTPEAVAHTVMHPWDTAKGIGQGVAAWADPSTRPTWEGIKSVLPEALGAGVGSVGASEGIGAAFKAAPSVGPMGAYASDAANRLYQSALKPSMAGSKVAKIPGLVQTGLENRIPVSPGGLENISDLIDDLNDKIKGQIDAGSQAGQTVNKFAVASRLKGTAKQFANQVNPTADLNTISNAGNEFLENQPTNIPVSDAQALKQGTYKQLKSNAYGQLSPAAVESQKALARGIKEELETQFPEIKGLNAQEGQLIGLDGALEKAVARISNHQLMGIGTPLAALAGKAATGSGVLGFASGVLKSIVDDPMVKSRLAMGLHMASKGSLPIPDSLARVAAYSGALSRSNASGPESPSGMQPTPGFAPALAPAP